MKSNKAYPITDNWHMQPQAAPQTLDIFSIVFIF